MRIVGRSLPAVAAALIVGAGLLAYADQLLPAAVRPAAARWLPTDTDTDTVTLRGAGMPWKVGIQVGHLHSAELPPELARLRTSTGAYAAGVQEVEVNLAVVHAAAALLQAEGVEVEILPATIPPGFDADAFIAVHADGNNNATVRGYKVSPPWRASPASRLLVAALLEHYGQTTGLPVDLNGVTYNMRGYYAFSSYRYRHAIADTTPAAILELGYLSNPEDRAFLRAQPEAAARGLAAGVLSYLQRRNPFDRWETLPPLVPIVLRAPPGGVALYASRDRRSTVRSQLRPGELLFASGEVDGWYDVRVRGSYRNFGWVSAADLEAARAESQPAPPPDRSAAAASGGDSG